MDAEVLICSHPRSGGRWLRYLLAHYLASVNGVEVPETTEGVFSIVPDHHDETRRGYPAFRYEGNRDLPLVAVCHQPYSWELHRGYPIVFLARNAYDVAVSGFHHLSLAKRQYSGTMRDFIRHQTLGIGAWVRYMNEWAPWLLTHRDFTMVTYSSLVADPGETLGKLLNFLDVPIDAEMLAGSVARAAALRSEKKIRTGQEGHFWDHLQPDEIFDIQEILHRDLSDLGISMLRSAGVEIDPFPRADST